MLGSVIGDIVGSTFEAQNHRSIYFEMFRSDARFTDDTVTTAAVADILQRYDVNSLTSDIISDELRLWCCTHLNRGYGSMFHQWILNGLNVPYNSYGNGALMRISPVALFSKKNNLPLVKALSLAKQITSVTHNHPQALLAVEIYITLIYYFLHNKVSTPEAKIYIKQILEKYNYKVPASVEHYRHTIEFDLTSEMSLLVSVASIYEAEDFESAIRNVVSIGGDSDTYAAITGGLAEAIWGCDEQIPEINKYFRDYDKPILEIIKSLY